MVVVLDPVLPLSLLREWDTRAKRKHEIKKKTDSAGRNNGANLSMNLEIGEEAWGTPVYKAFEGTMINKNRAVYGETPEMTGDRQCI